MKKLVLAVSALALSAVSASAADLAARPYTKAPVLATVYDWSGFYLGVNGGYGYTHDAFTAGGAFGLDDGSSGHGGGVYGGQFGYRVQLGQIVYGFDFQGDGSSVKNSLVGASTGATLGLNQKAFGIFAGTLGYAVNNVLVYAKGGAGFSSNDLYSIGGTFAPSGSTNETRWGGVLGAGLEYGFTPSWSAAFEYDHMFLQSETVTGGLGVFPAYRVTQGVDLFTARLNYHFTWGGPVVARY